MLRNFGKLFGASVAVAGPNTAQCRSQTPRLAVVPGKEDLYGFDKPALSGEWLVTDLHRDINNGEVTFEDAELDEAVHMLLGYEGPCKIEEVEDDADLHMREADQQLSTLVQEDFIVMLNRMLRNPDVQKSCVSALNNDPTFQNLLGMPAALQGPEASGVIIEEEPENHGAAESETQQNNLQEFVDGLANKVRQACGTLRGKAISARNAIGALILRMGANFHAFLGQPFSKSLVEEKTEESERVSPQAEAVGNALITVAIAILTLILIKRVIIVRC